MCRSCICMLLSFRLRANPSKTSSGSFSRQKNTFQTGHIHRDELALFQVKVSEFPNGKKSFRCTVEGEGGSSEAVGRVHLKELLLNWWIFVTQLPEELTSSSGGLGALLPALLHCSVYHLLNTSLKDAGRIFTKCLRADVIWSLSPLSQSGVLKASASQIFAFLKLNHLIIHFLLIFILDLSARIRILLKKQWSIFIHEVHQIRPHWRLMHSNENKFVFFSHDFSLLSIF